MSRTSDQRTQQGPGFPLHWPGITEGPISPSPVTREQSRDQASRSTDPENTAGTRLHTLSAPENAKDAKATKTNGSHFPLCFTVPRGIWGIWVHLSSQHSCACTHPITILLIPSFLLFDFHSCIYISWWFCFFLYSAQLGLGALFMILHQFTARHSLLHSSATFHTPPLIHIFFLLYPILIPFSCS